MLIRVFRFSPRDGQFEYFVFLHVMVSSSNFAFRGIVSRTFKNKKNSKNVLDTFLSLPLQKHSNGLHRNIKESVIASQCVDFAFLSTMVSSSNFAFREIVSRTFKNKQNSKNVLDTFLSLPLQKTRTDFIEILRNPSWLASLLILLFSARWSVRVISLFAELYRELLIVKIISGNVPRYISFDTAAEILEPTSSKY